VDLEGRKSGEPVLLLMNGGGGGQLEAWGNLIETIASMAPVVAYDRPGIGGSPFDGVDPTPQRVAEHAHELLAALNVPPPYILVGWSWGGPLIRYFAGAYPEEVVGMVYLDPSDMTASPAENIGAATDEEAEARRAELDSRAAEREMSPGLRAERRVAMAFFRTPTEERGLPPDLDVPTSVVLATRMPSIPDDAPSYMDQDYYQTMYARRVRAFTEWSIGRPETVLMIASDAGHAVHHEAPRLAAAAIRHVLEAVDRGGG